MELKSTIMEEPCGENREEVRGGGLPPAWS